MSDDNKTIKTQGDVVAAARAGMRLRAIAARAGMRLRDLQVRLEADDAFALAVEQAYADYEEDKRKKREHAAEKAAEEGNWSLVYKEAHDAVKELAERDNAARAMHVVVQPETGLFEPDYVEHSEEELAAIRARTESEANRDE